MHFTSLYDKPFVVTGQTSSTPQTRMHLLARMWRVILFYFSVTTILNPAPAVANLDREIYQYCDIVCPNESEVSLEPPKLTKFS